MDPKLSSATERLATIYVTYFITKYGSGLTSSAPDIVVVLMSAASVAWGIYKNRASALVTSAASVPGVRAIELSNTSEGRALSTATPDNVSVKGDSK